MSERYRVVGGSGDGATLPRNAIPPLEDFACITLNAQGAGAPEVYRREGDLLVFVEVAAAVVFVGGPFDGAKMPPEKCGAEGENLVYPTKRTPEKYAWYTRVGNEMRYTHSTTKEQMELVPPTAPPPSSPPAPAADSAAQSP